MRTIKFRAWDKENKRMWNDVQKAYDWIILDSNEYDPIPANNFWEMICDDNFILMQYTGLGDKNGVEIYEGDMVRLKSNTHKIYWKGEIVYKENGFWIIEENGSRSSIFNKWEVIGNIYENKKLLI